MAANDGTTLTARLPAMLGTGGSQIFGLLLGLAAVIAVLVGSYMWSQSPDYRVLYSNVSDKDGGEIVAALQQQNIPYKFAEGGGAILVPSTHVYEARLRLASQGLPKGSLVGFELMENPKFGTSQFAEQINYQRALEGELARSVQALAAVAGARVHLALTKPTVFYREQQKASASVLINLHPGRTLDPEQVNAIAHLVSSSVPNLSVKDVSIIDQNGNLLSNEKGGGKRGLDPSQIKYVADLELSYAKRIEAIVAPLVGEKNVRAQVTADIDFSEIEKAEEIYKPNQNAPDAVVRSQQTSESSSSTGSQAGGVPGALSNQPSAPASAPINGAAPAAAAGATAAAGSPLNTRKDSTVNYEVNKTIQHVQQPFGGIRRISAAVVVNFRKVVAEDGKVSYKPLTPQEITQINDLVREAMGYSKDRGDSLNVTNSAFNEQVEEVVPETPFWKQPATWLQAKEVARQLLIAGVALFLVLGVLRPLLKDLAKARATPQQPPLIDGNPQLAAPAAGQPAGYEQNLQMVKQLAQQEPALVANVVKNWVSGTAE